MAFSRSPRVGLVLLLHSFRSKATSWVTPTPVMLSFICWCHVSLHLLVPCLPSSVGAMSSFICWCHVFLHLVVPCLPSSVGAMSAFICWCHVFLHLLVPCLPSSVGAMSSFICWCHVFLCDIPVSGGNDKNAVVFNKDTEQVIASLQGHTKKVTGVIYHPEEVGNIGISVFFLTFPSYPG